jgi:iron-sulfur cluster repair protein YtfE (RIC family)
MTHGLWDEQTRPSSQQEPGAGNPAVGRHLVDVHDHLRAELARVRDVVEQVRRGRLDAGAARDAIAEMTLRQNDWTLGAYCASYCRLLTQHHGLEDASVFPHLREADPRLGPVLDRLEQEHDVIHAVLEGLDYALVEYVRDPTNAAALDEAVQLLSDTLLSHLAYEERELVPALSEHGFFPGQL